jgi:hypothetical protein
LAYHHLALGRICDGHKAINHRQSPAAIFLLIELLMMSGADGMDDEKGIASRRRVLQLGALGASAVMTVRPALATTMASVINCQIPVPDAARAGNMIAADGSLVPPGTAGAFAGPATPLKGADVKRALSGGSLPGYDPSASNAYMNYVRRLQHGQSGFTCYASLQMPGR